MGLQRVKNTEESLELKFIFAWELNLKVVSENLGKLDII